MGQLSGAQWRRKLIGHRLGRALFRLGEASGGATTTPSYRDESRPSVQPASLLGLLQPHKLSAVHRQPRAHPAPPPRALCIPRDHTPPMLIGYVYFDLDPSICWPSRSGAKKQKEKKRSRAVWQRAGRYRFITRSTSSIKQASILSRALSCRSFNGRAKLNRKGERAGRHAALHAARREALRHALVNSPRSQQQHYNAAGPKVTSSGANISFAGPNRTGAPRQGSTHPPTPRQTRMAKFDP